MRRTRSVCPVCLRPVDALLVEDHGLTCMEKSCPEHGSFTVPVWRGRRDMALWRKGVPELEPHQGLGCPANCGICAEHTSGTCCALLEVTSRCNLFCRYCFARGGETAAEPELDELKRAAADIMQLGDRPLLQLSGGEPTLRDDLPALIAYVKSIGCPYVQLNTNGLRLAEDEAYVRALADAGLSFVFMQFDGVDDAVYEMLRGRPLLETKLAAIRNCGRHGLGVTLVPTVVRGVNDGQLGDIVRLAVSLSPTVRGVHFQPVSYFGRYAESTRERYTLDELLDDLYRQLALPPDALVPSRCDHPMCGFHGSFVVLPDASLMGLSHFAEAEAAKTSAVRNREYIARRWTRAAALPCCCKATPTPESEPADIDMTDLDTFLDRVQEYGFTLTAMAFQDAMNLDSERLRHCSLHVWHDGKLLPFCARYLTPMP